MRQPLVRAIERARGPGGGIPPFRALFFRQGEQATSFPVRAGGADPSSPVRAGGLFPPSARRQHSCLFSPNRAGAAFPPPTARAKRGSESGPETGRLAEGASSAPFSTHPPPSCRGLDGKKGGSKLEKRAGPVFLFCASCQKRAAPGRAKANKSEGQRSLGPPPTHSFFSPHSGNAGFGRRGRSAAATLLFSLTVGMDREKRGRGHRRTNSSCGGNTGPGGPLRASPGFFVGGNRAEYGRCAPPSFPCPNRGGFSPAFHTAQNVAP